MEGQKLERKRHYTEEEIEEGLLALAFTRSTRRASELVGIPHPTLQDWRTTHKDRLERIQEDMSERLAQEHDAMVARLTKGQHDALDVFAEKVNDLKASDAASAVRNLAVAQGVHEDKALLHRGKPTERVEHSMDGLLRKLGAVGLVSMQREEIHDAEVVDEQPAPLPSAVATPPDPTEQRARKHT